MSDNILEIDNIKKNYKSFTLGELSLKLPRGVVMGLVGANGAGKSTLMKLILNIISPDSGSIKLLGGRQTDNSLHEKIGVVFDELPIASTLNAVQTGKIMAGLYSGWKQERYEAMIKTFELPENKIIKDFSRGMKMKLAIALAMSHNAELLILDEPTGGLDPMVRSEILDIFRDFMQDESHSILISSHITGDLTRIADYIAYIDRGRLLLVEEKDKLIEQYGVAKIKKSQLEVLDKGDFVGLREESFGFEALVMDRHAMGIKYPELVWDRADLDSIMEFVVGEARR